MRRPAVMWLVIVVCVALFVLTFMMAYRATTTYREQINKQSMLWQPDAVHYDLRRSDRPA